MTTATAAPADRLWLTSDAWRSTAAVVPAVVLSVGVTIVGTLLVRGGVLRGDAPAVLPVLSAQAAWFGYAAGYTGLTIAVFGRLDSAEFAARVPHRCRHRRWTRWLITGGGGFSWGAQMSLIALVAVLALTRTDVYRGAGIAVAVGAVAMVAGCWAITVVSYALHHARHDARSGGYEFAGDEPPVFSDYLSVAAGVATLLGPNITLTTNAARRAVTGQAVLAFVFNAVIVAVLVSTLLS